MRLVVKILAGVAIALLVLLGIVATVIATIDTRTLLAPIEAELERATGRDVNLGSEAGIDFSLTPTLRLNNVTVGNAPWGSAKEMIRAKRVEAQVALLPLLSRRVDIVRFTLVEPAILLETDKHGHGNWAFGESKSTPSKPSDPVGDAAGAFGLGEFTVDKGDLRWRNGRTGEVTAVRIERLYLRARDPGKPVVAEFDGSIGEVPMTLEGQFGSLAALGAKQWSWPMSVKGEVAGRKTEVSAKLREAADGFEASELVLQIGGARAKGVLAYAARALRPFIRFKLDADVLATSDLALAGGAAALGAGAKPPTATKPDGRLFAATPIPFDTLRAVDAQGELSIGKLTLAGGQTLGVVRARIDLADGRLDVPEFRANLFGGSAQGRIIIDARDGRDPAITLHLDARELDLASLMALAGVSRDVRGGKTQLDLDINTRGDSTREWASGLSGIATARVSRASWVSTHAGIPPALVALTDALNPLRAGDPNTVLNCAVVRLPFAKGVARVDRSIAFETAYLAGSASGSVDLRNETLDLAVRPRATGVTTVDLAKLAGAVRIRGPIAHPRVEVDPTGSIGAAAEVVALVKGGGKGLLANLLTPPARAASGPGECATALSGARNESPAARTPAAQSKIPPSGDPAQELTRALGKLLGR